MSDQERRAKSRPITADNEELQALRQDFADLDRALKKNMMGYTKASVEEYVDRLKINAEQMQMNLENQIRNLSAESSRLTNEGEVLRKQLVMADVEKSKIKMELGTLRGELEQSKGLVKSFTDRVDAITEENEYLKRTLKEQASGTAYEDIERKMTRLDEDRRKSLAEIRRLKANVETLSNENKEITGKKELLEEEKKVLEQEKNALEQEKNALEQEKKVLEQEKNAMEREKKVLEEEKDQLTQEKDRIIAEQTAYAQSQSSCEEEKAGLETALAKLSEEKAILEKEKNSVTEKYEKLVEEHDAMLASHQNISAESAAVSDMLEIYQAKEREYALLRVKDEQRQKILEENKVTINMLLEEMQKQLEIFETLSEDHRNDKETICHLSRENSNLESVNMELQDKLQVLTRQYAQLESESIKVSRQLLNQKNGADLSTIKEYPKRSDQEGEDAPYSDVVQKAREITKVYSMNGIKSLA